MLKNKSKGMKNIIVATDFSKEAENALRYAAAAAQKLEAKIILFNAFNIPPHTGNTLFPASAIQELIDFNNNILKQKAEELNKEFSIDVLYESSLMELDDEIDKLIKKHEADLVVMGMAPNSLSQDLFGNTTTSFITRLKFPVLAIPLGAKFNGINKILFACDILRGVEKQILDRIKTFALAMGAEVEVFSVNQKLKNLKEEHLSDINTGLQDVNYSLKNIESTEIIREIAYEIKAFDADILIMIPHKYSFWNSLIHQSKTRIMSSKSDVPLLSIPL